MYDGFRLIDVPRDTPRTFKYSRVVNDTTSIIHMAELFLRVSSANNGAAKEIAKDAYGLLSHVQDCCRKLPEGFREGDWNLAHRISTESLPQFEFSMDGVFRRGSYYSLYLMSKIRI